MTTREVFIFAGPTLGVADCPDLENATWLPPAAQGDLYAAARGRPWGIGLIDGYFERVPSVWHKEILWAMSRGVHVFGAASMGALRAAELTAYGMQGVGAVFEAFADGTIEDDDEVAVTHAPAELGFRAVSEAMVNIRATFALAIREGLVTEDQADVLLSHAKAQHYSARTWESVHAAASRNLDAPTAARLAEWEPHHRVDQKRADAISMLRRLAAHREEHPEPVSVRFVLQRTDAWLQVQNEVDGREATNRTGLRNGAPDAVLDELRLLGSEFQRQRERALARFYALELAERMDIRPDPAEVEAERSRWSRRGGAAGDQREDPPETDPDDAARLLHQEARVTRVAEIADTILPPYLRDQLQLEGRYVSLRARARHKQETLAAAGLEHPRDEDAALAEGNIWDWYFEDRLGRPVPDDLARWAHEHDFEDIDRLRVAALRERCYLLLTAVADPESETAPMESGE